jgi:CSLREA domain-containing protein
MVMATGGWALFLAHSRQERNREAVAKPNYIRVLAVLTAMMATLIVVGLMASPATAVSAVYTVNSTADHDGPCDQLVPFDSSKNCTLREAINAANNNAGADTINFSIPNTDSGCASGVCTIRVGGTSGLTAGTMLPNIREAVTIDGYTQTGASENINDLSQGSNAVLKVELDGTSAGLVPSGLLIFNPGGPIVSNVVIKGLVINRFTNGITMTGFGPGNRVEGNFIGTDASGSVDLGNGQSGVSVNGFGDTVGGTSPAARNVISGNNVSGVDLAGPGSKVEGNYIGTKADGTNALGNFGGVSLRSANTTVGGEGSGAANVIAFNNGAEGVSTSNNANATGNRILNNSIHSNGDLGINLLGGIEDTNGVTKNDKKDPDTGPNNLQNYPVLTSARANSDDTATITGKLNSRPRKTFTIQFFSSPAADSSSFGEGKTFLGQVTKKTSRKGSLSFTFTPAQPLPAGESVVTATATNLSTLDTSEFSKAVTAS